MKTYIKNELVENFIKERKMSKSAFCKLCGISYCTYLKIMRDDISVTLLSLLKISRAMNVHISKLIR